MRKKLALVVVLIGILGGGYAYYLFNKKTPGLENAKTDFQLTANELFDAFDLNETSALISFENKVIEVSGILKSIKHSDNQTNLIVAADQAMFGGINCSFNDKIDGLETGEEIRIKGRCQGFLMDVILNNCVIISEKK